MAFFDCHFFSDALGMNVSAYVLIPQITSRQIGVTAAKTRERYPALYLLHGLSDDHTIWLRRTSIERYAAEKNLAVVMPAVSRSFYQDMVSGPKYWTFISEELPRFMESYFPISTLRDDRFAAGLSMGGYGALRLGLVQPERYAAIASLSGALDMVRRAKEAGREGSALSRAELEAMFGPELKVEGTDADLFHLAQHLSVSSGPKPKLYVACGAEDFILHDTRKFKQHLDSLRVEHTYHEGPGAHEWGYWDQQILRVLEWLPMDKA
ncbi:alpha/beta hydrolase [Verrucomicrobiota bacterium sgz303538]